MNCEFCDKQKETSTPIPMCREHAIEFWRTALAVNRQAIERDEVDREWQKSRIDKGVFVSA